MKMPASFDGNQGNDGNTGNVGGGGNALGNSAGWFFPDRVALPFVFAPAATPPGGSAVPAGETIGALALIAQPKFPDRNWSADWYAWQCLVEFSATNWRAMTPAWPSGIPQLPPAPAQPPAFPAVPPVDWLGSNSALNVTGEIYDLVIAAEEERADALGEIVSQSDEFISYFLNALSSRPGSYPNTNKVLTIASLIGTFVAMYFKGRYARPRPSHLCPALMPPIQVPGHASFPSGHATQAHLMALCMRDVLAGSPTYDTASVVLWTLANRIARNREIAGLHYKSDTDGGVALALSTLPLLQQSAIAQGTSKYQIAVDAAREEWL
jgi:hypothetical protein